MVEVEQWAEIRRMHFVEGVSIKEVARRTGRSRATIRRALRAEQPPRYVRGPVASKLDSHKEEIHRLLRAEPKMPASRIRELIAEEGYTGSRSILEAYLREVRPLFVPTRTFQPHALPAGRDLPVRPLGALVLPRPDGHLGLAPFSADSRFWESRASDSRRREPCQRDTRPSFAAASWSCEGREAGLPGRR